MKKKIIITIVILLAVVVSVGAFLSKPKEPAPSGETPSAIEPAPPGETPPPMVNIHGKIYYSDGHRPEDVPWENIEGYITKGADGAELGHGQTNHDGYVGCPYAFVDGELYLYSQSWPFQDGANRIYYAPGWHKFWYVCDASDLLPPEWLDED